MRKIAFFISILVILSWAGDIAVNFNQELIYLFDDGTCCYLEEASEVMCPYVFVCEDLYDKNSDGHIEYSECDGIKTTWYAYDDDDMYIVAFWDYQSGKDVELFVKPVAEDGFHVDFDPIGGDSWYTYYNEDVYELYLDGGAGTWTCIWVLDYRYFANTNFTMIE
jgi:hypothetical protein